jgi:predicted ATPase with chaperone activity
MQPMHTLSIRRLQEVYQAAQRELRRRQEMTAGQLDDATAIHANEMAKRALIVAAAGGHSILFLGPPSSGKTMLCALALHFASVATFEARPCPCGYFGYRRHECNCTPAQVERHRKKLPRTDIAVETCQPPEREMNGRPGTGLAEMLDQVARSSKSEDLTLNEDGRTLLKVAVAELGIDADGRQRCLLVARSIANLDGIANIEPRHLNEAINYQWLHYRSR